MIRRVIAYPSRRLKRKKQVKIVFLSDPRPFDKEDYEKLTQYLEELEKKGTVLFLTGDIVQGIPTKGDK